MNNYISTYQKSSANEKGETVIPWKCEFYFPMENDYICYGVFTFGKNKQTSNGKTSSKKLLTVKGK